MASPRQRSAHTRRQWHWYVFVLAVLACMVTFELGIDAIARTAEGNKPVAVAAPKENAACLACHAEKINAAKFDHSAHHNMRCQDCHLGITQYPHSATAAAQTPSCQSCHAREAAAIAGSAHQHDNPKYGAAPDCVACHGNAHETRAAANLSRAEQLAACTKCHPDSARFLTNSAHGHTLPAAKGPQPDCLTCHGGTAHGITRTTTLTPEQKTTTCQTCHAEVVKGMASSVHSTAFLATKPPVKKHRRYAGKSPSDQLPNCFTCHGSNPHAIEKPGNAVSPRVDATCLSCHTGVIGALTDSAHGHAGKTTGRVNCLACHGENPHTMTNLAKLSPADKNTRCTGCHADIARALQHSVHGQAGMHGGMRADCVACHGTKMHAIPTTLGPMADLRDDGCKRCHGDIVQRLTNSVHRNVKTPDGKPASCSTCHGENPHAIQPPVKQSAAELEASCLACHRDVAAAFTASVHGRADKRPGDHPNCLTCHGGDSHGIAMPGRLAAAQQVKMCSTCHADAQRMARYGLTPSPVASYAQSFHGYAAMHFRDQGVATCADCHGVHGVLTSTNASAPTNTRNIVATCSKCHPGAAMNFANSGISHLGLKSRHTPVLRWEALIFQLLLVGMVISLLGMVVLDLRRKVFSVKGMPAGARLIGYLFSACIVLLVCGVGMAELRLPCVEYCWLLAGGCLAAAYMGRIVIRRALPTAKVTLRVRRPLPLLIQHLVLVLSFTLLALTGFPQLFAHVTGVDHCLRLFGGLHGARIVHRIAGAVLLLNWCWHLLFLISRRLKYRIPIPLRAMLPMPRDFADFITTIRHGLGKGEELPYAARMTFRRKIHYFTMTCGIIMGASGLVLCLPIEQLNRLPETTLGFVLIAHRYASILAFLVVLIWHLYHTHFSTILFSVKAAKLRRSRSHQAKSPKIPVG